MKRDVEPFKIFSVREKSETLLEFDIKIFEEVKDDIGADVDIKLNSAQFYHFHQVTCRLIDFFNYEMLGIFDEDFRATGYFKTEESKFDFAKDSRKKLALTFTNIRV